MKGKDLIKKIKELGSGKEIVFSENYMSVIINSVEVKNGKIILR